LRVLFYRGNAKRYECLIVLRANTRERYIEENERYTRERERDGAPKESAPETRGKREDGGGRE
jgi:hypothetical protein